MVKMKRAPRNWVAKMLRDLEGPFRPKCFKDKTKYSRKEKHRNTFD